MKKLGLYQWFVFLALPVLLSCAAKKGNGEFYGQITYKVMVGGDAQPEIIASLQKMFGDSIEVSFTDKGYRLLVYKDTMVREWYENETGTIYFMMDGVDTMYYELASEQNTLLTAEHRSDVHDYMGRKCKTYFIQDQQFHIEMWYDSSLYISPERFDKLYQGHYNRYYLDCKAPYLVRSLVMPPMNIRIEAIRIEQSEVPDEDWSERPDLPLIEFGK